MENPKISIITVSYNSEKTISKTIESVLRQTYSNFEYIIVDGKSKDNTILVANNFRESFKDRGINYTIISEPDNGIYDAMNKGIKKASGDIVGIINSDDFYEDIALETVAKTFEKEQFDMFFADLRILKKNGKSFIKKGKRDRFVSTRHWNHPTTFVTKSTYNDLGLFILHSIYDDLDLYLRIRKAKKKIVIKNITLANFVMGGVSNKKTFKEAMKRCKLKYWCYKNNGYCFIYWFECFFMEVVKFFLT